MKTMMSVDGKKIVRISDEKASQLYSEGFRFIPKSMWKEKVRDIEHTHDKEEHKHPIKTKSNKMSKAEKRHMRKASK